MTYSRSRTQSERKSKRRSRTRFLLVVNGILLCCMLGIAAFIWWTGNSRDVSGGKQAQSTASPANEPAVVQPIDTATQEPPNDKADEEENSEGTDTPASPGSSGDKLTFAFVGDILPAGRVLELMKINGFDYPFREAKGSLKAADITAGNLETPLTVRGIPAKNKEYVFRGSSDAIPEIQEAGFDFLSLANNHTLDYGWQGLSDTMDALDDAGLKHAGAGIDDREAYSPAYIERNGMMIGFVSVSRVLPEVSWKAGKAHPGLAEAYSPDRAVEAIKEAKKNADIVVVMVHWGVERIDRPVAHQTDLAHRFVDAGADLVIGSHPHVLQGFEAYKGKWIAYSLGNFIFSMGGDPRTSETGILHATCSKDGNCDLKFEPMFAKNVQPAPLEENAGKQLLARISSVSYSAAIKEDGTIVAKN